MRKDKSTGFVVEVEDNGVGMQAEDIPAALEPFQQVGSDDMHKQQGTGLGLPLAKAFVDMHGGSLQILSTPGEGTKITIIFPSERIVYAVTSRSA